MNTDGSTRSALFPTEGGLCGEGVSEELRDELVMRTTLFVIIYSGRGFV